MVYTRTRNEITIIITTIIIILLLFLLLLMLLFLSCRCCTVQHVSQREPFRCSSTPVRRAANLAGCTVWFLLFIRPDYYYYCYYFQSSDGRRRPSDIKLCAVCDIMIRASGVSGFSLWEISHTYIICKEILFMVSRYKVHNIRKTLIFSKSILTILDRLYLRFTY